MSSNSPYTSYRNSRGCAYCDRPITLAVTGFYRPSSIALEVFWAISILVLLASLLMASRFVWTKKDRPARIRTLAFALAALAGTLYFTLLTVRGGMQIHGTRVTYKFLIFDIFVDLLYRISDLLILAVVFSVIQGRVLSKVLFPFKWLALILLGLLTVAAFGLSVAYTALLLKNGSGYDQQLDSTYVQLAYLVIYFLSTVVLLVFSFFFIASDRSKSSVMLLFVAIALFIRTLIDLAYNAWYVAAVNGYYNPQTSQARFSIANSFIYVFMTWFIFLGVAIIGMTRDNVVRGKHMEGMEPVTEERRHYAGNHVV